MRRRLLVLLSLPLATALVVSAGTVQQTYADTQAGHDGPEKAGPDKAGARSKGFAEADKSGFGTSRTRQSKVWFTLEGGQVSEVFYPDLSTPSVRSLGLTVTDGA